MYTCPLRIFYFSVSLSFKKEALFLNVTFLIFITQKGKVVISALSDQENLRRLGTTESRSLQRVGTPVVSQCWGSCGCLFPKKEGHRSPRKRDLYREGTPETHGIVCVGSWTSPGSTGLLQELEMHLEQSNWPTTSFLFLKTGLARVYSTGQSPLRCSEGYKKFLGLRSLGNAYSLG